MAIDYADKIHQRATVTKEFLLIVIGLGLSGAIIERGFHHLQLTEKGDYEFWNVQFLSLLLYIFYATRFLINNWLNLCSSYDLEKLKSLNLNTNVNLRRRMILLVNVDLSINIYTGIIVSFVSIFWNAQQLHSLMLFLMFHYAVDGIIMLTATVFSSQNDFSARLRVFLWCINNLLFLFVFGYYLLVPATSETYANALWWWFVNCCIALTITVTAPYLAPMGQRLLLHVFGGIDAEAGAKP